MYPSVYLMHLANNVIFYMNDILYIYCDGGCKVHTSKLGGYGIVLKHNDNEKRLYGYVENTTNNAMELTAAIVALQHIKIKTVETIVTTDSNHVVQGMSEWIHTWLVNGWRTAKKKPIKNMELWQTLYAEASKFINIKFVHCYGHGDNKYNNITDELATYAMENLKCSQ